MGKHCSAEPWAVWVGEQREPELNVAEFCDWIGVSPNSFYRWRQKLAAKGRSPAGKGLTAEKLSAKKLSAKKLSAKKLSAKKLSAKKLSAKKLSAKKLSAKKLSAEKESVSRGPELVPLTVITSPVIEIDLPCGAVVRVPNEDRSLRRVLGILLEADQIADVSPIATPCLEHPQGGRR